MAHKWHNASGIDETYTAAHNLEEMGFVGGEGDCD